MHGDDSDDEPILFHEICMGQKEALAQLKSKLRVLCFALLSFYLVDIALLENALLCFALFSTLYKESGASYLLLWNPRNGFSSSWVLVVTTEGIIPPQTSWYQNCHPREKSSKVFTTCMLCKTKGFLCCPHVVCHQMLRLKSLYTSRTAAKELHI
jgi:hypothetical protein